MADEEPKLWHPYHPEKKAPVSVRPRSGGFRVVHDGDFIGHIAKTGGVPPFLARSVYGPTKPHKSKQHAVGFLMQTHQDNKAPKESIHYHIIETVDSHYCIVKVIRYKEHVGSSLVSEYDRLIVAQQQKALLEDPIPVNAASRGGIAGIGIGPQGEPGVKPKKKKKEKSFLRQWLEGKRRSRRYFQDKLKTPIRKL